MDRATAFKDARKATYLNSDGADRPLISPLPAAVLDRARKYRLERVRAQMAKQDVAALLLYDPVNIRYALDAANMQVWTLHNPVRYVLVLAGGPAILFEFHGSEHLAANLPGIDEIRPATSWMFMGRGDKVAGFVEDWAAEIADLMRRHGGANQRLAVDRLDPWAPGRLPVWGLTCLTAPSLWNWRARSSRPRKSSLCAGRSVSAKPAWRASTKTRSPE
jgi:Xaa-Pro dipeptidase